MTASLSDSADQLLDALEHVVAPGSPAGQWFVALAEHERYVAVAATDNAGLDLDELLGQVRESSAVAPPLSRADVADRATERAAGEGREDADIADVAAALLASALSDRGRPFP